MTPAGGWIPAKGGRSSSTSREVPAAPSPPLGGERSRRSGKDKKSQEEPQWVGRSFPTAQHKLRKGNVGWEGTEEAMGAAGTRGERARKQQQGAEGPGWGMGKAHLCIQLKKKIVKHPQNPAQTPSTPPGTSQREMGRQSHPLKSASSLKHLCKDQKGKEEEKIKTKWKKKKKSLKLN